DLNGKQLCHLPDLTFAGRDLDIYVHILVSKHPGSPGAFAERSPMTSVQCPCGKVTYGSEAMAGQAGQCMKCGAAVQFPAPRRQPVPATVAASPSASLSASDSREPIEPAATAPP